MRPMDKLWAPWRINYITNNAKEKKCLFCKVKKARDNQKNLVVFRSKLCFVMLNLFPYNNGHLMVSPYRHISNVSDLNKEEMVDLFKAVALMEKILTKTIKSQGYNIGINSGKVAGAGLAGHLHIHLVPRWQGDTNFMPIVAETKVISQSLQELYKLLRKEIIKTKGVSLC